MSRTALLGLLDSLEAGVRRLRWSPSGTEWGDYYEEGHTYSPEGLERKAALVSEFLAGIGPLSSVWDLGANTGRFSRIASRQGIPTLSFDVDHGAVERNYLAARKEGETNLLPLLLDLTNPSPAIGWENRERHSLLERGPAGAVLALALVHHLAISNNTPLESVASLFHRLGRWLIIEFVPKSDSQVQRLLSSRSLFGQGDIFPNYTAEGFERAFGQLYQVRRSEEIPGSERRLYLMEGR